MPSKDPYIRYVEFGVVKYHKSALINNWGTPLLLVVLCNKIFRDCVINELYTIVPVIFHRNLVITLFSSEQSNKFHKIIFIFTC